MATIRQNITMPIDLYEALESNPEIVNKSAFISECVRKQLEIIEKQKIEKEMAEGYSLNVRESYEVSKEWDIVNLDGIENNEWF